MEYKNEYTDQKKEKFLNPSKTPTPSIAPEGENS